VQEISVSFLLHPHDLAQYANRLPRLMNQIGEAGLDGVVVGDHVSFHGGTGADGLIQAAALLAADERLVVKTGIYLLPLRHPVLVARQLATIAQLAPSRLVFGVGVGGEDPHEFDVCEVDPRERGARTDEALPLIRKLLSGDSVTHHGRFYNLSEAVIAPAAPDLPVIVGGRSNAALVRAGRYGDGWIGVWISHRRYAEATELVEAAAAESGRNGVRWRHEHQGWCFFDRDQASAQARAREVMEAAYELPFERFAHYTPCGTAEDVANGLRPFLGVGCRRFNLVAVGPSLDSAIEHAGEVKRLLRGWPETDSQSTAAV
jgi:alkanesulfonate monooxygenase SsuD/methylene tetrahydromethanopterin reductase-like flavin-dependent oxidoreductase (luciferase family)